MNTRKKVFNTVIYILAAIWGIITFIPLVITLLCSFKDNSGIMLGMLNWPKKFIWKNYLDAFRLGNVGIAILNSIWVALASTIIIVIVGMLASYVLSRKKHLKGMTLIYSMFIVGVMIPVHSTIIPIASMATGLHARNTYTLLILVYVAFNISQAIFLFTGYLNGVSRELDEAAIIDGCGDSYILFKILFPLSIPIITTEVILAFVYGYSELIFSMCLISEPNKYNVSRAMLSFQGNHIIEYGPIFACIILAVIPMIIIYVVFHEKVQSGMLTGAVKG